MWGAIIQAIDHAMGRMHEGAGAGIKVANSQHGGGAPISNMDSGAGEAVKQDLRNQQDTTSEQEEAAEQSKIGSNSTSTGAESAGAGGGIAEAASSILSDEDAKTSKPVGESMRAYGANAGKGFANAGAIATGSKAAEWEDIDNSFVKKAAEDTVKGWRKKDFNSDPTNK